MEILNFQDATVRTVHHRRKTFQTLQFFDFDEALEHLVIGDEVLAFHNCGRYLMKVYAVEDDCITCSDDVGIVQFKRKSEWVKNGLERVVYY